MNKYNEIMDRVRVDEEMKSRILENVNRDLDKAPSGGGRFSVLHRYIIRYAAIAAVFAVLAIGTYAVINNGGIIKKPASTEKPAPAAESAQSPAFETDMEAAMEQETGGAEVAVAEEYAAKPEADSMEMPVTDGYASEQEAKNSANEMQRGRIVFYVYDTDSIEITATKVTFNKVQTEGISDDTEGSGTMTLVVDKKTVFAKEIDFDSFSNYEDGQSPLEWIGTSSPKDLSGEYEVDITGNHIDSIHGYRPPDN